MSDLKNEASVLLKKLAIADDEDGSLADYVVSLLEDPLASLDEKRESLVSYLSALVEDPAAINEHVDILLKSAADVTDGSNDGNAQSALDAFDFSEYGITSANQTIGGIAVSTKATAYSSTTLLPGGIAPIQAASLAGLPTSLDQIKTYKSHREPAKAEVDTEEYRRRQALLERYSHETQQIVETATGESEIVYKDTAESGKKAAGSGGSGAEDFTNSNKGIVQEKEKQRREQMRKEHQKQVDLNKQAALKKKLDAEKEKQRTQKKEKRRM
ncbi:hypothetical protein GQ42DRAFT_163915 [Ramicandelaber brevisporus]|nr:hypothetical protein GQ42DRAFT_163915 [Ramicandelaber brevisporus]